MMILATFWMSFDLKSSPIHGDLVDKMENPLFVGLLELVKVNQFHGMRSRAPMFVGLLELEDAYVERLLRSRAPLFGVTRTPAKVSPKSRWMESFPVCGVTRTRTARIQRRSEMKSPLIVGLI